MKILGVSNLDALEDNRILEDTIKHQKDGCPAYLKTHA